MKKNQLIFLTFILMLHALYAQTSTPAEYFEIGILSDNKHCVILGFSDIGKDKKLTNLVIPTEIQGLSVQSIGYEAFSGCASLTSVTLPEGLTEIRGNAFYGCTSLTSITFPKSLTKIGFGAFSGCTSLTSITFPENIEKIFFASEVFCGCKKLPLKTQKRLRKLGCRRGCF